MANSINVTQTLVVIFTRYLWTMPYAGVLCFMYACNKTLQTVNHDYSHQLNTLALVFHKPCVFSIFVILG